MCIGQKIDSAETLNFNNLAIKNSKGVKVLGITLDRNTKCYVKNQSLPLSKKTILLCKSMIKSQFNY